MDYKFNRIFNYSIVFVQFAAKYTMYATFTLIDGVEIIVKKRWRKIMNIRAPCQVVPKTLSLAEFLNLHLYTLDRPINI